MHDNAPCHRAKIIRDWIDEKQINILEWPPNSPDLNPIENLFGLLKKKLNKMKIKSKEELKEKIQEIWENFDKELCSRLVNSLPRRLELVFKQKGGNIPY